MRGKAGGGSSDKPPEGRSGGYGSDTRRDDDSDRRTNRQAEDRSGGRFESLRDGDDRRSGAVDRDSCDRRTGGGGGSKTAFSSGGGGDWWKRQDGRRSREEDRTELEVFGEPKKSTAGIDFDKYDAIPVQVTGSNVDNYEAINRFSEAKLTDSLFENLTRCGYARPTPVQKHSIPIVASGRDLMACAQTGSGKTCAFMVPCIESLLRSGPPANPSNARRPKPMPCGLVLAPTRELAAQIHVESLKFSYDTGIRCCIVYGGADMKEQREEMQRGLDILVATPGRLTDMCDRGFVSLELVQFFILDEADRMLDMGFEPQVRQIVVNTGMGRSSNYRRQSMMFSATFAREVQVMAQDFLEDYVFITVGRVGSASELVKQHVIYAEDVRQKTRSLEKSIAEHLPTGGLAVVFVETKKSADTLELDLHNAGIRVAAIHGDRSQTEREEALAAFKSGQCPVLVATDVAARGLDIPNISLVINFDMPKQLDDYVHRIGRTGRAGRKGVAFAFVNERTAYLPQLGELLVEAKQELPLWFEDLVRSASRRVPKGAGRGETSKIGGQDLRMEKGPAGIEAKSEPSRRVVAASSGPPAPARGPNSWGNSGMDDAW